MIADIDLHPDFGIMNIDDQFVVDFQNRFADFRSQFLRIERELFIASFADDFERASHALHHFSGLTADRVQILFHFDGGAYGIDAEHLSYALSALIHIAGVGNVNAAFRHPYMTADVFNGFSDIVHQRA